MADWPTLALLKQALGIPEDRDDKDDLLQQALAAAIEGVVADCGGSPVAVTITEGQPEAELIVGSGDEDDLIEIDLTDSLAAAALLLAVSVMKAPDAPFGVASTFDSGGIYVARHNPNYTRLLKGNRVRFGIA